MKIKTIAVATTLAIGSFAAHSSYAQLADPGLIDRSAIFRPIVVPNGPVYNAAAVAAGAAVVVAATEVAHHYKERWIPGLPSIINPVVMNAASPQLFDVQQ